MKPVVMQLVMSLRVGGAERLALSILRHNRDVFSGAVCGLFHDADELAGMAQSCGLETVCAHGEQYGRIRAAWQLSRILRRHRVAVLHAQSAYALSYALPAAKLAGVPVFYTEHALHSLKTIGWLRRFIRAAAPFIRAISCVNAEVADFFTTDIAVGKNKITVIENGVDTDVFSPEGPKAKQAFGLEPGQAEGDTFIFGNVARLCEAKDHPNLLRAFDIVRRKRPNARLVLVGDGEARPAIESLCRELDLKQFVRMAGTSLDIPAELRAMNTFVLSSKREGLPVALLEAMSCGLPVISTDVGGVSGLNATGERLALVPPGDSAALAESMLKIMDDESARNSMAQKGRDFVRSFRGGAAMSAKYKDWYKQHGAPL